MITLVGDLVPNPDYTRMTEGLNRITAKLSCATNNNTMEPLVDIKSNSVFITGLR